MRLGPALTLLLQHLLKFHPPARVLKFYFIFKEKLFIELFVKIYLYSIISSFQKIESRLVKYRKVENSID